MGLLVRKIALGKWSDSIEGQPTNADALTNCLKTSKNKLSVWLVDNEDAIDEGILAIAASQEHLDKIDVVCFEESELKEKNIAISNDLPGDTACTDLKQTHRDLCDLNAHSLEIVAQEISSKIRSDKRIRRSRSTVKLLLETAIANGRIKTDDLHEDLSKHFKPQPSMVTCETCGTVRPETSV